MSGQYRMIGQSAGRVIDIEKGSLEAGDVWRPIERIVMGDTTLKLAARCFWIYVLATSRVEWIFGREPEIGIVTIPVKDVDAQKYQPWVWQVLRDRGLMRWRHQGETITFHLFPPKPMAGKEGCGKRAARARQ